MILTAWPGLPKYCTSLHSQDAFLVGAGGTDRKEKAEGRGRRARRPDGDARRRKENQKSAEEKRHGDNKTLQRSGEWSPGVFCGSGSDGFVEHVSPGCQGARVWWYGGGCRTSAPAAEEEEEEEAKTGPETNLPLPPLSHRQTASNPIYQKSC